MATRSRRAAKAKAARSASKRAKKVFNAGVLDKYPGLGLGADVPPVGGSTPAGAAALGAKGFGGPRPGPASGSTGVVPKNPKDPADFLGKLMRKPEAAVLGASILAQLLFSGVTGVTGDVLQAKQQGAALDVQGEFAPQIQQAETERGISKAQRDQAMFMLLQQMGVQGPNTATGEVYT
jgi:hypothetical protein